MSTAHFHDRIRFGAAYYYEYARPDDPEGAQKLERDFAQMREAAVSLIRVGESVWSRWEPENGRFDLDWLEPVLDAAERHGIAVILGTPTYAVPMWMARQHPEIAGDSATGTPLRWGSRQEMDFTHPAYRFYCERVIRAVIGRYATHPALAGVQVDNEPGLRLLYNHDIFQAFVDHLRAEYGTVERLNEQWGLVYWSHELSTWADLWVPDGNLQPQYDLAWRRFQADLVTEFIGWQADIAREVLAAAGSDAFVTTCISYDQAAVADVPLAATLDIASANVYYRMQEGLAHPSPRPMSPDWIVDGPWAVYQLADLTFSSRQAPFLVTETNAGGIGHGFINEPGYDGQWRQIAWALVSRGARAIEYWHWHTLHYGAETYWIGMLPHDGVPGRVFAELAAVGREFERLGHSISALTPMADIGFVYSSDAKWALSALAAAPLVTSAGDPERDSYRRIALPFYRSAFDAGLQVNHVRPEQLAGMDPAVTVGRLPVLVAAGWYTTSDADLDWMRAYVEAGGHLILGPRTAYADDEARARATTKPARLADLAGADYQEFETLRRIVRVRAAGPDGLEGGATEWVDYLRAEGGEVLAAYEDRNLARWPAIVTHAVGAGRVTTCGTVPDPQLGAALMRWAVPQPVAGWPSLPASVRATSAIDHTGDVVWFVHNWSSEAAVAVAPQAVTDLVSDTSLAEGDPIHLAPWDVRVLRKVAS